VLVLDPVGMCIDVLIIMDTSNPYPWLPADVCTSVLCQLCVILQMCSQKVQVFWCVCTQLAVMSLQGLADSCADKAAGRAIRRQDLLSSLDSTVQHRQERTAQQAATHQALLDRQASHSMQHKQSLIELSGRDSNTCQKMLA